MLLSTVLAGIQFLSGCFHAAESSHERISINNDWRFTRNDPSGDPESTDILNYPVNRSNSGREGVFGRRGAPGATTASVPTVDPTAGIAAFILPTGNEKPMF